MVPKQTLWNIWAAGPEVVHNGWARNGPKRYRNYPKLLQTGPLAWVGEFSPSEGLVRGRVGTGTPIKVPSTNPEMIENGPTTPNFGALGGPWAKTVENDAETNYLKRFGALGSPWPEMNENATKSSKQPLRGHPPRGLQNLL